MTRKIPFKGPQHLEDEKIVDRLMQELNISKGSSTSYKTIGDMIKEKPRTRGWWRIVGKFRRRVTREHEIRVACSPGNDPNGSDSELCYLDDSQHYHRNGKDLKSNQRRFGKLRKHNAMVNGQNLPSEEMKERHMKMGQELTMMASQLRRLSKELAAPRPKTKDD